MIRRHFLIAHIALALLAARAHAVEVGRYKTLELVFEADCSPANPFDTYLLKVAVTDPKGTTFTVEGFYDGDGSGGQEGRIWKVRLCPSMIGEWSWRTVPGDAADEGLQGLKGTFTCVESGDRGGVVADRKHFRFQSGDAMYLVGNFLDIFDSPRTNTTHIFMSDRITDADRERLMKRQRDFHTVNKANIYFANRGDYRGHSVTPWVGTSGKEDLTQMDLARWKRFDGYIGAFKDNGILAELWFFADDSNFGRLADADQDRLLRYAMARTSAFSHTLYVIALEWAEGFKKNRVSAMGGCLQAHNPWGRLLSVHNQADWQFAQDDWPGFIATQSGFGGKPSVVNALAVRMRKQKLPHIDEEFGVLRGGSDAGLRSRLWACFCGGAAGSGTGSDLRAFQRFLAQSKVPFQRMAPANQLVADGGTSRFCLAEPGHHYVAYSSGGAFALEVQGTDLKGCWFNPRDSNASLGQPFAVAAGKGSFTPPESPPSDWVLWITDGSNLNRGVAHPSTGATITREIIKRTR